MLETHILSKFPVHKTLLLTTVTMLYFRSPELIHLITESLYPLTNISPFPPPITPLYFFEHLLCSRHLYTLYNGFISIIPFNPHQTL